MTQGEKFEPLYTAAAAVAKELWCIVVGKAVDLLAVLRLATHGCAHIRHIVHAHVSPLSRTTTTNAVHHTTAAVLPHYYMAKT